MIMFIEEIWITNLVIKNLGLNKVHKNKFRRPAATMVADRGIPIEQVRSFLGHS